MRALTDLVPFPLAVSGRHGYWGASPKLEEWTHELIDALAAGEPTASIVQKIGGELFNERAPTPDEMDFDEDAYWAQQLDLQQQLWEDDGELHAWSEAPR
jgi:hypothetical protein